MEIGNTKQKMMKCKALKWLSLYSLMNSKKKKEPVSYESIDYLYLDGSHYIDTEIVADKLTEISLDYQLIRPIVPVYFFGNYQPSTSAGRIRCGYTSSTKGSFFSVNFNSTSASTKSVSQSTFEDLHFVTLSQGAIYYDDSQVTSPYTASTISSYPLTIGGVFTGADNITCVRMNVNSFLLQKGRVSYSFFPVVRNDGVEGLYDEYNDIFLIPKEV